MDIISAIRELCKGDKGFENMFEHAHPKSTKQWLKHMISVEHIESVIEKYNDVRRAATMSLSSYLCRYPI